MTRLEDAINVAIAMTQDPTVGYSQTNRTNQNSKDLDCSRFVQIYVHNTGSPITDGLVYTGNMREEMPKAGWAWHPGTDGIRRGDVLWKTGHTAIFLGDGSRAEAWIDETGGITGPTSGDQTGQEVRVHAPWNDITWEGYFRAPISTINRTTTVPQEDDMTPEQAAQLNRIEGYLKVPGYPFGYPAATHNALGTLTARVAAQDAAIQALATAKGVDGAAITKAITAAVDKALSDVSVTLTAKEK